MTDDHRLPSDTQLSEHQKADFTEFYRQNMPRLTLFIIRLGASFSEASDVAQQAFARAYPKWPSIHNHAAYLWSAAKNELIRRAASNLRETSVAELPDSATTPDLCVRKIEFHQEAISVIHAISSLPPRQREVMAFTLDGFTPKEIAEILGTSPGTVRGSLLKARRELRARLNITQGSDHSA